MRNLTEKKKAVVFEILPPGKWWELRLGDLWRSRELLSFFIWREIKVRYSQTFLGAGWAIIQPFLTMIVFSVIFGNFAKLPSEGFPYPIYTFSALLPWQLFARGISEAGMSLVNQRHIITKVYFPRIYLPLSIVLSGLLDFAISLLFLFLMLWFYQQPITVNVLYLPILVVLTVLCSSAVALLLSAFSVSYRDFKYIAPFLVQLWFYATPVAYSGVLVPENWKWLYNLNPMVPLIEAYRWALLGTEMQFGENLILPSIIIVLLVVSGITVFQRLELRFADKV